MENMNRFTIDHLSFVICHLSLHQPPKLRGYLFGRISLAIRAHLSEHVSDGSQAPYMRV
jgi:hypothetical protein